MMKEDMKIGSLLIAKSFNKAHKHILHLVSKYGDEFNKLGVIGERVGDSSGGRKPIEYMMNEDHVLLLVSLLRNDDAKTRIIANLISASDLVSVIKKLNEFDFDGISDRYVYAVQDVEGNVKIGISVDPERRVKELNLGNSCQLKLIFTKNATGSRYHSETELHGRCSQYRIRSEWFTKDAIKELEK